MNTRKTPVALEQWKRINTYQFFKDFDNPFFQLGINLPVGKLRKFTKEQKSPLMMSLYYLAQRTLNSIEEFRYRIEEEAVMLYEETHVSTTVLKEDKTFGIVALESCPAFADFSRQARQRLNATRQSPDFFYGKNPNNLIHCTTIPWVSFTAIQHARKFNNGDSSPKLAFGKLFGQGGEEYIPMALDVHHALADAYHAGLFFEQMQRYVNAPEACLT